MAGRGSYLSPKVLGRAWPQISSGVGSDTPILNGEATEPSPESGSPRGLAFAGQSSWNPVSLISFIYGLLCALPGQTWNWWQWRLCGLGSPKYLLSIWLHGRKKKSLPTPLVSVHGGSKEMGSANSRFLYPWAAEKPVTSFEVPYVLWSSSTRIIKTSYRTDTRTTLIHRTIYRLQHRWHTVRASGW